MSIIVGETLLSAASALVSKLLTKKDDRSIPRLDGVYRHVVQMRGLPFRATEEQVRTFFGQDVEISAVQFEIGADHRPTGRARCRFLQIKNLFTLNCC